MRAQPSPVLIVLACLLTGAASADDFCLLRYVLPSHFVSHEELPLDDPNSDFVEATDSCSVSEHKGAARGGADLPDVRSGARQANGSNIAFSALFTSGHQHPLPIEFHVPLRC
jgi:hypothetical protein